MWRHAMSAELKKLPSSNDRAKVSFLNDHLSKVTFTNIKFDVKNLESLFVHVKSSGLVLTIEDHFVIEYQPHDGVSNWKALLSCHSNTTGLKRTKSQ